MIIKCTSTDGSDNALIRISDSSDFELINRFEDGIYLILSDREILLRDTDYWCSGRDELPTSEVDDLYNEIIDVVADMLVNDKNVSLIDIDDIESRLFENKYYGKWCAAGYVDAREDGTW